MRATISRLGSLAALVCALLLLAAPAALAHEHRHVDGLDLTVGWASEPTVAGYPNAVQLIVEKAGSPQEGGTLQAEVLFGGKDSNQKSQPIDLVPSDESPGEYDGFLIPTRPGTYTFHITGKVGGVSLDQYFISGETTFDDAADPQAAQFPAQDPSSGQLAQKIERLDSRLAAAQKTAEDSAGDASRARTLAVVGIAVGAVALVAAVTLRRKSGPARG